MYGLKLHFSLLAYYLCVILGIQISWVIRDSVV